MFEATRSSCSWRSCIMRFSTFVGKIRATNDTLTVDYSVIPVDESPLDGIDAD